MLEDISSPDLPSFISGDVAEDIILFANNFSIKRKKGDVLPAATNNMAHFLPKH